MLRCAPWMASICLSGVLLAQQPGAPGEPAANPAAQKLTDRLAAVVDRKTPAERQAGVAELLSYSGELDAWLDACRRFGTFASLAAGAGTHTQDLQVLDQVESTELHLFVPKSYDPAKPAPLLLWAHGQGGTGKTQWRLWRDTAEQLGMLVLAPRDPNTGLGFSKKPRERAAALAALRWVRRIANVDENAVFVGGWSRGGHLAWDLMLRHPDLFAGALPVVGGPLMELTAAGNLRYLENIAHLPIRDLQGSGDDPRLLRNLHLAFASLKKLRAKNAELIEFADLRHSAKLEAVDWAEFFSQHRRAASPKSVVRVAAELGEARQAWLQITDFSRRVEAAPQPQVDARRWQRMDEAKQAAFLLKALGKHTARLEVVSQGNGRFQADGFGVTKFALLLCEGQIGKKGKVQVRLGRRTIKRTVEPSAEVLLRDFVECFDRTRLPVVRIDIP
ncbi:MAG: hypothetical protein AB8H80_16945 [Planctomycetota bacterium]